jgi:hypothetical protein
MQITHYGPGDAITWGACAGHPHDPRTPEPEVEYIAEEDAPELAADLIRSTPATFSAWLAKECAGSTESLDWYSLTKQQHRGDRLTVPQLLAVVVCGFDVPARKAAQFELVERFDAAHAEQAQQDAADMLDAQAREAREIARWGDDMGCTQ